MEMKDSLEVPCGPVLVGCRKYRVVFEEVLKA